MIEVHYQLMLKKLTYEIWEGLVQSTARSYELSYKVLKEEFPPVNSSPPSAQKSQPAQGAPSITMLVSFLLL
jgi:hypothetical protein